MNVRVEPRSESTGLIVLEGRLDLVNSATVKEQIQQAVAAGLSRLVVDLRLVPFIDSSGLAALIGALKATRMAGGDLRLARLAPQVKYVLEITLLDRVLSSHGSVEEAFARYE